MNEEEFLNRATQEIVTPPHLDQAAQSEAEIFDEERRRQFWWVFALAIVADVALFATFIRWVLCDSSNWHIGLMLILPATSILLALLQILKSHHHNKQESKLEINISHLVEALESILGSLKK